MKYTVYNAKGGVGKSRVAMNLAFTLGLGYVTNDYSYDLDGVFPEGQILILEPTQDVPDSKEFLEQDLVFDLGGYADERAIKCLKMSDYVICPVLYDRFDIRSFLNFINEISEYNSKILVIVTKTEKGDFERVKEAIEIYFPDLPIFELKKSTSVANLPVEKISIAEMVEKYPLHKKPFSIVAEQFQKIIDYIS